MTSKVCKRQKVGVLPKASKSVLLVSASCLDLIGHFLSLGEFLRWRTTCNSILLCTRERFSRWKQYNHAFTNDDRVQSLCSDMYGFITSKLDAPEYYETRPDFVPSCYFPYPRQLARASISRLPPDVLLKVPLRLLNALGGIDALALLPSFPLLDRHFSCVSFPTEVSPRKALLFTANDFNTPITVCYNEFITVIVFRTLSCPYGIIAPVSIMWYTCLNALEWWCEFSTMPTTIYLYDVLHVSRDMIYVVQVAQSPPSVMSFLRPYLRGARAVPLCTQRAIRYDLASLSHSTVWVAMEHLETLVSARVVTHVSIAHQESIVRLADDVFPAADKQLLLVLDWAHTQIRLPLLFPTMATSWSPQSALESALRSVNVTRHGEAWDLHLVPMGAYTELCDDESFPLSDIDVLNRLPVLIEHFHCPIMQALHSLFSKGNRGLRPRISEHAAQCLANAANILSHRLYRAAADCGDNTYPRTWRHKVLQRRNVPELLSLFTEIATQERDYFIAPTIRWEGFRTHEVLLFEACHLDSSFFQPIDLDDDHFEATGEPSPEFMCNICACKHNGNPLQANQIFAATHATRARILREKHFQTKHFHARDQPTLCLLDPSFPQQLDALLSQAEASDRPLMVSVNVPAYHLEDSVRGALLNRLAVTYNLTTDNLSELSGDRYYLHSVALVLEPDTRLIFVCDINQPGTDYEYINLGHVE
jgi:hypothetical protein